MEVFQTEDFCGVRCPGYNYLFRKSTGLAMRWGWHTDQDPFWGPAPELADISISNRCTNSCSFCYRDSTPSGPLMSIEDFTYVMKQLPATFQLALGGGEPLEHPKFLEFLRLSRKFGKVPNYTTNGMNLSKEIVLASKKYCGAVAVSWSDNALPAIWNFLDAGIKTNIHFILSKKSIEQGIQIMNQDGLFGEDGVNSIVFLLHKAVGRGSEANTPSFEQVRPLIREAFSNDVTVAFDVCTTPHIVLAEQLGDIELDWSQMDYCDGSRFTVHIDEQLNVSPCSFVTNSRYTDNLKEKHLNRIWHGEKFSRFRNLLQNNPHECIALKN